MFYKKYSRLIKELPSRTAFYFCKNWIPDVVYFNWVYCTINTRHNLLFSCFLHVFARFWCKNQDVLGLANLLVKCAMLLGNSCTAIFSYFLWYMNLEQNWKLVITSLVQVLKCVTFWNVDPVSEKNNFWTKDHSC